VKINSALPSVGNATGTNATRGPNSGAATAKPAGTAAGERVEISSLSARLQEVGSGEAPIDAQRVAEIKQAISEGRFQINPERIADGLIASVRDMLGRAGKSA
jgi:negative regulator of flagellin synthesis FlgM